MELVEGNNKLRIHMKLEMNSKGLLLVLAGKLVRWNGRDNRIKKGEFYSSKV